MGNKLYVKSKSSISMGANCYLVGNDESYIIIDPIIKYSVMNSLCKGKIKAVLITHGHFDHFEELESYLENSDVKIYGHKNAKEKLENPVKNCSRLLNRNLSIKCGERFTEIKDNDELVFGDIKVRVMETKGHTDCCVTYIIEDNMFTGDFIFKGSIGRTDLYSGNNNVMKDNLEKFKLIKNDYVIYPGHGDSTTIKNELESNMYLKW